MKLIRFWRSIRVWGGGTVMKRGLHMISIALVFFLAVTVVVTPTGYAQQAGTVEELAYLLYRNAENAEPERPVVYAGTGELDTMRLLALLYSVLPEKSTIKIGYTSNGFQTKQSLSLSIADAYAAQAREKAKEVTASIISDTMTPREKICAIHDYLILNCAYDTLAAENGMTEENAPSFSISGPLLFGTATCDGYAAAMMLMCRLAGIPCFKVTSYAMNHALNYVYDGQYWSFVDVTQDDPLPDRPGEVQDTYFMRSTQDMLMLGHIFDPGGYGSASMQDYDNFFAYVIERDQIQLNLPAVPQTPEPATEDVIEIPSQQDVMAAALVKLGIMTGTESGLELDRSPNRREAVVMLTRLLGLEQQALDAALLSPFADAGWAESYIGYLYHMGLIMGIGDSQFGGDQITSVRDYATFVLRALGYSDQSGDFSWENAVEKCRELGIVRDNKLGIPDFTRGDMAEMTIYALMTDRKGTAISLADYLAGQGAFDADTLHNVLNELRETIPQAFAV